MKGYFSLKSSNWIKGLFAAVLATGLAGSVAVAQTAGQDIKNAGSETKAAAKDTGHATAEGSKTAYRKTKTGSKKVAHKTANGTKEAGEDTKAGAKEAGRRTANAGDALAGKPEKH